MRSFPWDSLVTSFGDDGFPIYDRDYMASDLREVYKTFFSNGVFMDTDQALQVTEGDGMNVLVAAGNCNINGTIGYEKNQRMLTIQASDTTYDRIDTVVLRWNANVEMRNIDLYVKTGVAQQVPVRPTLTRSETVFELGLGDVFVNKGAGAISAARITDTRLENERCGMVMPFASIDTTTFYSQIQAAIDDHIAILDEQTQKAVELAQNAIDGTTAGNLQNQIDANKATDDERYEEFTTFKDSRSKLTTDEAIIGEWIDGSTLYRMAFVIPNVGWTGADKIIPTNFRVVSLYGSLKPNNTNACVPLGARWTASGTSYTEFSGYVSSDNHIKIYASDVWKGTATIFIEYVKS